jgi:CMP-N,N'-diacetyllegionaminic acid synthase
VKAGQPPVSGGVIALICARGGSKGLPRKNLLPLGGKPLILHTIEHALASGACDVVLVSTDDAEIAAISLSGGAEVVIRPDELGGDLVPTEPVLQHALLSHEAERNRRFDVVVFLQPTDVFRTPALIAECVSRLRADPSLDSVFSGFSTHKNFWRLGPNGYERVWKPEIEYGPRQTAEPLFREDTGLACASRAQLIRDGKRIGPRVDIVATDRTETSVDIHTQFDLWLAERILTDWPLETQPTLQQQ